MSDPHSSAPQEIEDRCAARGAVVYEVADGDGRRAEEALSTPR